MGMDFIARAVSPSQIAWLTNNPDSADLFIAGPRDSGKHNSPRIFDVIWDGAKKRAELEAMPAVEGWVIPEQDEIFDFQRSEDVLSYLLSGASSLGETPIDANDPIFFLHSGYYGKGYIGADDTYPSFVLNNDNVKQIALRLQDIPFSRLTGRYDEAELEQLSLNFRGNLTPEDYLAQLEEKYARLKSFIERTADTGKSMILTSID